MSTTILSNQLTGFFVNLLFLDIVLKRVCQFNKTNIVCIRKKYIQCKKGGVQLVLTAACASFILKINVQYIKLKNLFYQIFVCFDVFSIF